MGEGTGTVFSIPVGWSGVEAQKKSGVIQDLVGKLRTSGPVAKMDNRFFPRSDSRSAKNSALRESILIYLPFS